MLRPVHGQINQVEVSRFAIRGVSKAPLLSSLS